GVTQSFVGTPYSDAQAVTGGLYNSDGSEIWPCFGSFDGSDASTENPDCQSFKDTNFSPTTLGLPAGAGILGTPSYTWSLAACDQTDSSVAPCGQTNTWYEDDSNDSTDELLYIIEATQGTTVIADSGTVDFGPNVYGGLSPAADVVIYGDQGFGNQGISGENTGNCTADYNYPLTTAANPGEVYIVQANKTCAAPVAGLVKLSATTEVATPAYTKSTSKTTCAPAGGEPCYTVKWTVKYKVLQSWYINLQ
ncbi:MAG TPA: hypothetical protein VMD76_13085, partial [Candidatus Sulfotelmatobacter sp.]|nr:hypothetical protein [Candidatus Sulfotelmatobacter sp.]